MRAWRVWSGLGRCLRCLSRYLETVFVCLFVRLFAYLFHRLSVPFCLSLSLPVPVPVSVSVFVIMFSSLRGRAYREKGEEGRERGRERRDFDFPDTT
jgi:hypothetical protein